MADKPSKVALQVFAVPELLENILNLVDDPIKLFVLQGVCKTFQALIATSTTLRRRMCLEPDPTRENLKTLLSDQRIVKTTAPFRVNMLGIDYLHSQIQLWLDDDKMGNGIEVIDIAMDCNAAVAHDNPSDYFDGTWPSDKSGSWRHIMVANPAAQTQGIISCENTYWSPCRPAYDTRSTLRDLVVSATSAFIEEWDLRLEKCIDEGHVPSVAGGDDSDCC